MYLFFWLDDLVNLVVVVNMLAAISSYLPVFEYLYVDWMLSCTNIRI